MSYANGTIHYNLPLTAGSDKRDWADTNQAFEDIDAAIYQASEGASSATSDVAALDAQINGVGGIESRLGTAESDIDNAEGAISTLQGTVSGHTTEIADVRRDLQNNIAAFNEPTATSTHAYSAGDYFFYNDILYKATDTIGIGDTIVPNTNCTATTVTTEMLSGGIDADEISYDNTTSGLAATDVQAAIDEVKSALANKTWTEIGHSASTTGEDITVDWTVYSEFTVAVTDSSGHVVATSGVPKALVQSAPTVYAEYANSSKWGSATFASGKITLQQYNSAYVFCYGR